MGVKRKAKVSSDESVEEVPPRRKWKVKQVPSVSPGDVHQVASDMEESPQRDVPVVKWKAKMPLDDVSVEGTPVVEWKAHKAEEKLTAGLTTDLPVKKWKINMPADSEISEDSDVPVVKWKAKMPPADSTAQRNKAISSEDSDVPVIKWKAKMPTDTAVSKRKAKGEEPDVPVVKWKAKMPAETSPSRGEIISPEDSDVPVIKWKAKMPKRKTVSPEVTDVPLVKLKARSPVDHKEQHSSDVRHSSSSALKPQGGGQARLHSPKNVRSRLKGPSTGAHSPRNSGHSPSSPSTGGHSPSSPRNGDHSPSSPSTDARSPNKSAHSPSNSVISDAPHTVGEESARISRLASHQQTRSSSSSPVKQPPEQEVATKTTSLSRRSSFCDSRSPSPPSISPQVRMSMGSPVSRRRTPSPARAMSGTRRRQSSSPVARRKRMQLLATNHQLIPATTSTPGLQTPSSKLRNPRSHSAISATVGGGLVKPGAPMVGLARPSDLKQKRVLPNTPATGLSPSRSKRSAGNGQKPRAAGQGTQRYTCNT